MIAPDTSVLIAGFDSTHPFFAQAETALAEVKRAGRLIAHTIAETFAVLSAPAGPYPALPEDVVVYLRAVPRAGANRHRTCRVSRGGA